MSISIQQTNVKENEWHTLALWHSNSDIQQNDTQQNDNKLNALQQNDYKLNALQQNDNKLNALQQSDNMLNVLQQNDIQNRMTFNRMTLSTKDNDVQENVANLWAQICE